MGCSSEKNTQSLEIQPVAEPKIINIIFKLSTGEEYEIKGKENEIFKNVLNKFISEHPEINNKTINALYQNTKIDIYKSLSENNITENNLIVLNIEEPEKEEEENEDNISIEYNPENVLWIDENVDNDENTGYLKELNSLGYRVECFKNAEDGVDHLKYIEFESTKVIISGRLYIKFIKLFIDSLDEIFVIPKIIIFTRNKSKFIENNKENEDIINHPYFCFGGIRVIISDIIKFLKDEITQNRVKKEGKKEKEKENNAEFLENRLKMKDNAKLTFEYIDNNQKLALPLLYNSLIDSTEVDDIDKYTDLLYSKYAEDNYRLRELLTPIKSICDIPLELLSKYYARAYTIESDFYRDINKDLRENKTLQYLPYIKVLYEGVKLKSLKIATDTELYRGSKISIDEIDKIRGYLDKKKTNLPAAIVFSKSFLSFSKEKSIAENFLYSGYLSNNLCRVLYVLEKDENIDYSLSTHTDIEKLSIFNSEKEVLFFPFSPFEIKEINVIKSDEDDKTFEVRLFYLGKYLKEIEKDVNIVEIENQLPDSEFKKQIIELGLIKKDKIKNTKQVFKNFKQFQNNVKNNKYKKYNVKDKPNPDLFKSQNLELVNRSKTKFLTRSYNRKNTFIKNKLSQSQINFSKSKTVSYDESFTITTIEDDFHNIKVININVPKFLGEYLIPIWFEKGENVKFNTEGNYRINNNSQYHNSVGIKSSMKFNYGALVARIGSGESFILPPNKHIYHTDIEGPLYLKINYPKNIEIKPEGKLKIKIYDGELMSRKEIYEKIGWKEKNLKYANKQSTLVENDLTVFLNNLRMNPILFYDSYVKDENINKTWTAKFLEDMGKNNDAYGMKDFSVNNEIYEFICNYIELNEENIKKTLTKKNSIEKLKELQDSLQIDLRGKMDNQDIIVNFKIIKKSEMKHICMQYLYDKTFIPHIFDKEYNSIAIKINREIFEDSYLIILAIAKINNTENENE